MAVKRTQSTDVRPATAAPTTTVATGVEAWVETQAAFVSEVERLARSWAKRRMEAVDQARHIVDEMKTSGDPSTIFTAQQTWVVDAFGRAMSDLTDLNSFAMNLANQAGGKLLGSAERARDAAFEGLTRAGAKPLSAFANDESSAEEPSIRSQS